MHERRANPLILLLYSARAQSVIRFVWAFLSRGKMCDLFEFCWGIYYARACWRVTRRMLWTRSGQLDIAVYLVLSVYVSLTLKAVGLIDCLYMTDRLQPFVFYWRTKSPISWMPCRGSAEKHHIYIFGWTVPLRMFIYFGWKRETKSKKIFFLRQKRT